MGMKRRCDKCGIEVGRADHVELKMVEWKVDHKGKHLARRERTLGSMKFCPGCAIKMIGKIYEEVG